MGSTSAEFKNPATSTLLELVKSRRTYYGLKAESPISDDVIQQIVEDSVLHVPSSFNTQTSRVVLLLKEEHQKVWDIAISAMEGLVAAGVVPKEMFENHTKPKLDAFRAAYGTVRIIWDDKRNSIPDSILNVGFLLVLDRFSSLLTTSLSLPSRRSSPFMPTSSIHLRWSLTLCLSTSVRFSLIDMKFAIKVLI